MRFNLCKMILTLIFMFIMILLVNGCAKGNDTESVSDGDESGISLAESASDGSSTDNVIEAKIGDVISTKEFDLTLLDVKVFNKFNYYNYFTQAPENGKVYIALYFEINNTTNDEIGDKDLLFMYRFYASPVYTYVNGYISPLESVWLDESLYTNKNPRIAGGIPAGAKTKGCLAWAITEDWTDFEYDYNNVVKFKVSISDITNTGKDV